MPKELSHLEDVWEMVVPTDAPVTRGYGVFHPQMIVVFRPSTPTRWPTLYGRVTVRTTLDRVPTSEFRRALEIAAIRHVVETSHETWHTVDSLSQETTLLRHRVRELVNSSKQDFVEATIRTEQGQRLYGSRGPSVRSLLKQL